MKNTPVIDSPVVKNDTVLPQPEKEKGTNIKKSRGFLVGVSAGPEWNQVRGQKLTRAGYDIGIVAGYRFSSKISVETGLALSKKYYYSSGKYFKLTLPGKEIMSLEGSSSIIEIPLKLKYDFINKKRSSFFTTVGLMSYLLTNEKNDYILLVNGAQMNMTNEYTSASRYFASAMDISFGFEYYMSPYSSVRLAPYIQIPFKGIGVGSMQVMSSGIHAAYILMLGSRKK